MKNFRYFLAIIGIMAMAAIPAFDGIAAAGKEQTVYYFYVTGCTSCVDVEKALDNLSSEPGYNLSVKKLNITETENQALLERYFTWFAVPEANQIVPIVFAGDLYFSGKDAIIGNLEAALTSGTLPGTPELQVDAEASEIMQRFSGYRLLGTFFIGLLGGVNPCALTAIILFLSMLMTKSSRILSAGLTYCAGKFVTYLLLGTVAFTLLSSAGFLVAGNVIRIALSVLLFVVAVFYLLDAVSAVSQKYERIRMQLPQGLRVAIKNMTEKVLSYVDSKNMVLLVLTAAVATSLLEFLCTGQIYLATIIYAVRSGGEYASSAFLYLLVYCTGFIVPYLIVTFLLRKGQNVFETSNVIRRFLPVIKMAVAVFFIVFSIANIFI